MPLIPPYLHHRQLHCRENITEYAPHDTVFSANTILEEETTAKESEVKSGSIQGSVLGPVVFLMFIQDISIDMTINTKIFVDDTKIKEKILTEEDVINVQENLDQLYKWQEPNNMQFHGTKFQIVRHGANENIKKDTTSFTDNIYNRTIINS